MAMALHIDGNGNDNANLALRRLIRVRQQIDNIDDQTWDLETRLSLAEICDIVIDMMKNGNQLTGACQRFTRILNGLISILRRWHNNTISFRNFMSEEVDKAEEARNRGNETQMVWTGVNCLANAAGLAAILVPGLNVPLIIAGVGGSVIGVWKRVDEDKKNKKEFADIMNEIEGHNDYKMIVFSDVITQMQRQFEETRNQLMENYKFEINAANIVATLQMIIDSMLNNLMIAPQQQQGIEAEIAVDILSQLKNFVGVAFQNHGRQVFNVIDDGFGFELMIGVTKGLSIALVAATFAINFYQLFSETKDRAEKVRKVTKMKDKLQSGADSIQFFINTMSEIREKINLILRSAMEEELGKMKKMNEQTSQEVVAMRHLLQRFIALNTINGNEDSNVQLIDFTEN